MGSGKQPTLISRMLDFVMSHTGYYHVLREKLNLQKQIDELDDDREENYNITFKKNLKKLEIIAIDSKNDKLMKLYKEIKTNFLKNEKESAYYEQLDDELREMNIKFVSEALDRTRDDANEYEREMILTNKRIGA
ncbi:hypothetical protein [uncultured Clostridium sp.]|uniref:hypothetical protein n=1 Tax=uncultured Clostridium sp. TaxID=59620 RepID=UPI00263129E3|nr:hypothetical protein [uncultured Clostridium sp.]